MNILTKKSFKDRRASALSIFHKAKSDLTVLRTDISNRRKDIAKLISSLSDEDTDIANESSLIDATLIDINSIFEFLTSFPFNYVNNNLYIAEDFANTNIFDELYCKLYLDHMELPKHKTSDVNFCFFEKINTDTDKVFGKTISTLFDDNFYTFDNTLNAKNLSIKFYNNYNSQITSQMWFKCKISFECI